MCLWSVADRHLPRWSWQAKDGTGREVGMTASQHGYSGRSMGSDVRGVLPWLDAMQKLGCIVNAWNWHTRAGALLPVCAKQRPQLI